MRRALLLVLTAVLTLLLPACGGDDGGGEAQVPAGAFGGADDCSQLVEQTVDARRQVVDQLGDARRTDTERIDEALTSFGEGPDLAVRYDDLGCGQSFDEAVCAAMDGLRGAGPAGRDLVATWTASCG